MSHSVYYYGERTCGWQWKLPLWVVTGVVLKWYYECPTECMALYLRQELAVKTLSGNISTGIEVETRLRYIFCFHHALSYFINSCGLSVLRSRLRDFPSHFATSKKWIDKYDMFSVVWQPMAGCPLYLLLQWDPLLFQGASELMGWCNRWVSFVCESRDMA